MNNVSCDVLKYVKKYGYINQRTISENIGCSIGSVNASLQELRELQMLDDAFQLTKKAETYLDSNKPQKAVILAAGYGMRMVPINFETPKALLQVKGEVLVERMIRQLHEVGITDITIVVGFMKEAFEYLMDDYNVKLKVNRAYAEKNNLHSLALVGKKLADTYIVPGDLYCNENPFSESECYSWYMIGEKANEVSDVRVNRKGELVRTKGVGNRMIGISYVHSEDSDWFEDKLMTYDRDSRYDGSFWEELLFEHDRMKFVARLVSDTCVSEINTYEQLRDLDSNSAHLDSEIIDLIADTLDVEHSQIYDIKVMKKGMTNRSFLFACEGKRFIMRIPGEGTSELINRKEEYNVYQAIKDLNLCDDIYYINPDTGYKITEFIDNTRVCDLENWEDVSKCMKVLKKFHEKDLKVDHEFDIWKQIEHYEKLWNNMPASYRDYGETLHHVKSLKGWLDKQEKSYCLTHIDAIPDNFLIYNENGQEKIRLIDWEYSGMQDPHVDIAMFAIYSLYDREQVDQLIDTYFEGNCNQATRVKIYVYISMCGLLWSNWCEYKKSLGIEFGEYSLLQYRYAKDYYRIARAEIEKLENK